MKIKERDIESEVVGCGFFAILVCAWTTGAYASEVWLLCWIGLCLSAGLLLWVLSIIKYVLIDGKLLKLQREIERRMDDLPSSCQLESVQGRQSSQRIEVRAMSESLRELRNRVDEESAKQKAINKHYGITVKRVKSHYKVKETP